MIRYHVLVYLDSVWPEVGRPDYLAGTGYRPIAGTAKVTLSEEAHKTSNDALKAEGVTKSVFFSKKTFNTRASFDVKVLIGQTKRRGLIGVVRFSFRHWRDEI